MQITVLQELSDHARKYEAGEVVEMPDDQAKQWIEAGYAVEGSHPTGQPEQAARHTGHKR